MKWMLLGMLLLASTASSQITDGCIKQLEELIKANEELTLKAKELEELQKAHPELQLESLEIVIDKSGRIFVTDLLVGKLKIGSLSYDVVVKLKTTILKDKKGQYGFNLRLKAAFFQSYELDKKDNLRAFASGGLAFEPFYYRDLNFNLIIGPRLYGPAVGIDITEHFGGLVGVGLKYNDEKAPFVGMSFDF